MKANAIVLILAMMLAAGCGGDGVGTSAETEREGEKQTRTRAETNPEETTPPMETTTREETSARADTAPGQSTEPAQDLAAYATPQYGATSAAPSQGGDLSANDQAGLDLLGCQTDELAADLGPVEGEALFNQLFEEASGGDNTVQALLAERGYTCGGRAAEVLGQ